ncbi:MAG: immunoglobulin domain-containing protein [Lachnospiraceae bacterium]|nr:immunoglobulin domain-containing protein [Lachnospiraceae bacterium]
MRFKKFKAILIAVAMAFSLLPTANYENASAEETAEAAKILPTLEVIGDTFITADKGDTVTMEVDAGYSVLSGKGDCEISYLWYYDDGESLSEISSATSKSYSVKVSDSASYVCRVTYTAGENSELVKYDTDKKSLVSANGPVVEEISYTISLDDTLTVKTDEYNTITGTKYGGKYKMKVEASTKVGELSYQWEKYSNSINEYVEITDATADSYEFTIDSNDGGKYRCAISNGLVREYVYFTTDYTPYTIKIIGSGGNYIYSTKGSYQIFGVEADPGSSGFTFKYQWSKMEGDTSEFVDINKATSATYEIASVKEEDFGNYLLTLTIMNGKDIYETNEYRFDLINTSSGSNPYFTMNCYNQNGDSIIYEGDTLNLEVRSNVSDVSYEWFFIPNGQSVPVKLDVKDNLCKIEGVTEENNGCYLVTYTYTVNGETKSGSSSLDVNINTYDQYIVIEYTPSSIEGYIGSSETLYVEAYSSIGADLSYQWYKLNKSNGSVTKISGATSSRYIIDELKEDDFNYYYYCVISDGINSEQSGNINLYQTSEGNYMSIKVDKYQNRAQLGDDVTFTATLMDLRTNKPFELEKIQWSFEGNTDKNTIIKSTSNKFTISNVVKSDYGRYKITARNPMTGYSENTYVYLFPDYSITFAESDDDTNIKTENGYTYSDAEDNGLVNSSILDEVYYESKRDFYDYSKNLSDEYSSYYMEYSVKKQTFTALLGDKVTMDASATVDDGSDIYYQWYIVDDDDGSDSLYPIKGATNPTLTVDVSRDDVTKPGYRYICELKSNTKHAFYTAEFTNTAGIAARISLMQSDQLIRYVTEGEEVTIKIDNPYMTNPKYKWGIPNVKDMEELTILDVEGDSYTFTADSSTMVEVVDGLSILPIIAGAVEGENTFDAITVVVCVDPSKFTGTELPMFSIKGVVLDLLKAVSSEQGLEEFDVAGFITNTLVKGYKKEGAESITVKFDDAYTMIPDALKGFKPYVTIINAKGETTTYCLDGEDLAGKEVEVEGDTAILCVGLGGLDTEFLMELEEAVYNVMTHSMPRSLQYVLPLVLKKVVPLLTTDIGYKVTSIEENVAPTEEPVVEPTAEPSTPEPADSPESTDNPPTVIIVNQYVTAATAAAATASAATKSATSGNAIGTIFTYKNAKYKILSEDTVILNKILKNPKSFTIPAKAKYNNVEYKVVSMKKKSVNKLKKLKTLTIGKNVKDIKKKAIVKCPKLKTITINSTKLKTVGASAFAGAAKKLTIKVPKKKKSAYKKLLKKSGLPKGTKIK